MPVAGSARTPGGQRPHRVDFRRIHAGASLIFHLGDPVEIQDQPDAAVAQNRAAGDAGHVLESFAQGLDDHLLLADQFIHQDAEALSFDLGDHQHAGQRIFALRLARGRSGTAAPRATGTRARAPSRRAAARSRWFRRWAGTSPVPQTAARCSAPAHAHHQPVDDGQRERQFQQESGAFSRRGADLDAAAQFLDVAAHHVHADAAAGDVGHLRGGAEAGLEDEVVDLIVAEAVRRGDQALLDGLGDDLVAIQAAAVVGDFDDHLARPVMSP
jgi:hypothetical protein